MTSWLKMLEREVERRGDDMSKIRCTLTREAMQVEFRNDFGSGNGEIFMAWSDDYAYSSSWYDGAAEVASMLRVQPDNMESYILIEE